MNPDHYQKEQVSHYQSVLNRYWYEATHNTSLTDEVKEELLMHLNEAEQALHFFLTYGEEGLKVKESMKAIGNLLTHGSFIELPDPIIEDRWE